MSDHLTSKQVTANRIREVLDYDPETGIFRWKVMGKKGWRLRVGDIAGHLNKRNRRTIHVDGRLYFAHRLAWLYMTGDWPEDEVDHVNCDSSDNRWANLREANRVQNSQNRRGARSDSRSGFLGVHRYRTRWVAQITINKQFKYLGIFDTPEEASKVYLDAKRKHHEFNTL